MTDRAVSSTLNYVISLAIATLLVTGLFVAGGNFVDDRRESVVRSELQVVGQQVAADLARVDRLAVAGRGSVEAGVDESLPGRITGASYRVWLFHTPQRIVLNTTDPEVSVTVRVATRTDINRSRVRGGDFAVRLNGSALEVSDG